MQRERRIFWKDVSGIYGRCDVLLFYNAFDAVENERKTTPNLLIRGFLVQEGPACMKIAPDPEEFSFYVRLTL